MEMPGVGPLIKDAQIGWYVSEPVAAGALRGAVGRIVVDDEALIADPAAQAAVANFLGADDRALRAATPDVHAYYLDTARDAERPGWGDQLPTIAQPDQVWEHVRFGDDFHVGREGDEVYVSVECECDWEPEHGLELVFRNGQTISKVGPYDGHLTNAAAYGQPELDNVVYVSRDALIAATDPVQPVPTPSRLWTVLTIAAGLFLLAFGAFVVSVGQADDSPGLGGLGLITMLIGFVLLVRLLRSRRRPASN